MAPRTCPREVSGTRNAGGHGERAQHAQVLGVFGSCDDHLIRDFGVDFGLAGAEDETEAAFRDNHFGITRGKILREEQHLGVSMGDHHAGGHAVFENVDDAPVGDVGDRKLRHALRVVS